MLTVKGTLNFGYLDPEGKLHTEFEMRVPEVKDMEWAIEQAPENACTARISRYVWSRTLVRLGDIHGEQITPELLGGLHYSEYSVFDAAEQDLMGKLRPASAA